MAIWKPQYGIQLNRSHPLADGVFWPLNEGRGGFVKSYGLYKANSLAIIGSAIWKAVNGAYGINFPGTGAVLNLDYTNLPDIGTGPYTVIAGLMNDTSTAYCNVLNIDHYDPEWVIYNGVISLYDSGAPGVTGTRTNIAGDGKVHNCVWRRKSINSDDTDYWMDGVKECYLTHNGSIDITSDLTIGNSYVGNLGYPFLGTIFYVYLYWRALTEYEIKSLNRNPYQMFDMETPIWLFVQTGGGETVTFSGVDTLSFTGNVLSLNETFNTAKNSLSLTGQNMTLLESTILTKLITSITGKSLNIVEYYYLRKGSITFTGKATFLNEAFKLLKSIVSFTGKNFSTNVGVILKLLKGSVTWTGNQLNLVESFIFSTFTTTFTGKNLLTTIGTILTYIKSGISFTGKVLYLNESCLFLSGILLFGGKSIIAGSLALIQRGLSKLGFSTRME